MKKGTAQEWRRRKNKLLKAQQEFKKYNDRVKQFPPGKYWGILEITEELYQPLDIPSMKLLYPNICKNLKRKKLKCLNQ